MKKIIFVLSLLSLEYISAMEPEEKQATVQITVKGEDIAIPFDEFGSDISGSLGTLSYEDQTTLGGDLSGYLGKTVIVNKKDLVIKEEEAQKEAKEHMIEKAKKKQELQSKTLAFVHGWMARQKESRTEQLKLLHKIKKESEENFEKILEEHQEKLEEEED